MNEIEELLGLLRLMGDDYDHSVEVSVSLDDAGNAVGYAVETGHSTGRGETTAMAARDAMKRLAAYANRDLQRLDAMRKIVERVDRSAKEARERMIRDFGLDAPRKLPKGCSGGSVAGSMSAMVNPPRKRKARK